MSNLKDLINNRSLATFKVKSILNVCTKTEISEMLKISRVTLDKRLKDDSWRLSELEIINTKIEHYLL